jgi:xylan 1,4-beta-xylosidase
MIRITRRQALATTARIAAAAMLPASTRSLLAQTTQAQRTPVQAAPALPPASPQTTPPPPADASGISGPGRAYDPANPIEFHHVATGSAVKDGLLPPITPIWDLHLRDTVICLGGDGNYYMTGSSGADIWVHNDGVELWRSADLRKWDYLGLVWNTQRDGHWEKTPMDLHGKPVVTIWAPEIHYIKKNYFICLSMAPAGISILRSTTGKPEGPYRHAFSPEAPIVKAIDPTLFEDDDGKVYFTHSSAKEICLLKPDLSGFDGDPHPITLADPDHTPSHHAEKCTPRGSNDLGTEGATLCKIDGRYYLGAADSYEGRYSTCAAISDHIFGPYHTRHETVPCGGGTNFFADKQGLWWCAFFGNDSQSPWREKPGLVAIDLDQDGRIVVNSRQPLIPTGRWTKLA